MRTGLHIDIYFLGDVATRELAAQDFCVTLPPLFAAYPCYRDCSFDIDVILHSRAQLFVSISGLWELRGISGFDSPFIPMGNHVREWLGDEDTLILDADSRARRVTGKRGQPLQPALSFTF
ncbi:MAG: hypothetical protein JWN49_490 [Parcubacteria group bacterium]|nr:hypothetical protein [Parcubacteria group bacterium]